MKKTGAQIICESLIAEEVDVMFGFPGEHFRIGLGRKNLGEALERVSAYLEGI